MKKIIICNNLLIKSKILLNLDLMITVSYNNWFNQNNVDNILEYFKKYDNEQCIVITCCGMGAKVLIAKLHKLYPNNIYLDFGSALDQLCTKKNTRAVVNSYNQFLITYKDLIPDNWDDKEYDYIEQLANQHLGLHLK